MIAISHLYGVFLYICYKEHQPLGTGSLSIKNPENTGSNRLSKRSDIMTGENLGIQMPSAVAKLGAEADALMHATALAEGTKVVQADVNDDGFISANAIPADNSLAPNIVESVETVVLSDRTIEVPITDVTTAVYPNAHVVAPQVVAAPVPDAYAQLQQQHNVLQGKYNTEVPRLHQENTALRGEIQTLSANMQALQAIVDTLTANKPAEPAAVIEPITPINSAAIDTENFSGYGSEMVELVNETNALKSQLSDALTQINTLRTEQGKTTQQVENVGQQVTNVGNTVFDSKQDVYFGALDRAIPYWETLNSDQVNYWPWLQQPDGFSGRTRQDSLKAASEALNASAVIGIMTAFINETGYKPPVNTVIAPTAYDINSVVTPVPTVGAGEIPLGGVQDAVISPQDVEKAAADCSRGLIDENAFNKVANAYQLQLKRQQG